MTQAYRSRSDETWARARDDYLAGMTAEQVCLRHDLGLRSFWNRAADEGWRRCDQPDPAPDEVGGLGVFDDFKPSDLEDLARLRMVAAMTRGHSTEALRWRRVYAFWRTEAEALAEWMARDEELAVERRRAAESAQSAQRFPPSAGTDDVSPPKTADADLRPPEAA